MNALLLAVSIAAAPSQSSETAATALYAAAVSNMDRITQPRFLSYELRGKSDGIHVGLMTARHEVWLTFERGSAPTDWRVKHRTQDYASEVFNGSSRFVSPRPIFDPTWFGAFRALRDGMLGYQNPDPGRNGLSITEATPTPDPSLHTIASVSVMGPAMYAVRDRGLTVCPNGDAGHALHLVARSHNPRWQLSDVVVDLTSMRFCSIRFGWQALWFSGFVEQHYGDVDGYWLQTDGLLDGTVRLFGIKTHHFIWNYEITDVTLPQDIPPPTFIPDPAQ